MEEDRLRSPAGAMSGTVGEILSQSEESSSYRLLASDAPRKRTVDVTNRRSPRPLDIANEDSDRDSDGDSDERRPFPVLTVILATTLVVLLIGWWGLSRGERQRRNEVQVVEAALPILHVTSSDGSWVLGQAAGLAVHADRLLDKNLTVRIALNGSAISDIDFTGLPTQVEIPAGQDFVRMACTPMVVTNARQPAVQIEAVIQPSPTYQVSATSRTLITLDTDEKLMSAAASGPRVQWLSDLPFVEEWSSGSPVGRNLSYKNTPLTIHQRNYPRGLSIRPGDAKTEPEARVSFALDGSMDEFLAEIGIDDEMKDHPEVAVIFQVWVDNTPQFDSGVFYVGDPIRAVRINVAGAKNLRLVVRMGGKDSRRGYADWGGARLIRH